MTKRQFPFLSSEFDNDLDFSGIDDLPRPSKDVLALMMQDIMNRDEGKVAPDTAGADYFLLEEFITNEMELDFAVIEQDFMKHCGKRLQEFNEAGWYGEDERWKAEPEFAVKQKLLRLMYNGAKLGDAYCVELVKYLYKVYHKREYNQLKRFHKITVSEIFSLSEDKDGGNSFGAIGRILKENALFNPENIVVRQTDLKKKEEPRVITNVAPVSMGTAVEDDYLKEIADLRRKVNEQEQKINGLREQCRLTL